MDLQQDPYKRSGRRKRVFSTFMLFLAIVAGFLLESQTARQQDPPASTTLNSPIVQTTNEQALIKYKTALEGLYALPVKGRAPKTGYTRTQFGNGWEKTGTCDMRNRILARDLKEVTYQINSCVVLGGALDDPYTAKIIPFARGSSSSSLIQIDHVVALSDSWQKGAQLLTLALRQKFANDGLNLLAVDGQTNQDKSDSDAATWLPPNKPIRCPYVARQVSVKLKYSLWVTGAEKNSIENILKDCPLQPLVT